MSGINPGDVVGGRYRIAEPLGAGGMARVYRATDMDLGRDVAVKVLSDRYAADPAFVERFRREASAAAQLNHPNIVQVFDRGAAGGTYYIVMEYLPGPDLKEIIRRRGTISPDETVEAGLQILSALSAAHRRDVIHRDIKPQNVIMSDEGMLKVTDFGIARAGADADMTEAGSVIGTAQYISPEQAKGGEVTSASDCYSVGIVLYEMLTGRVPFDGEGAVAVAMKQVNEPPIPPRTFEPSIPPALEAVVLKALAKRASERYRTAEDFSAALMDVRAHLDQGAATSVMGAATAPHTQVMDAATATPTRVIPPAAPTGAAAPRPASPPPRRRAWPLVLALLALIAIVGVGAAIVLGGRGDGVKTVTVPAELVGQTEQDARAQLVALGLRVSTEPVESEAAQKGLVVGTTPAGGRSVDAGGTVVLQIGSGPATVAVKNVVGKDLADAQVVLRTQGFTVKVVNVADDTAPKGRVLSQDPAAGAQAAPDSVVTLRVSSGPAKVSVPHLVGLQQSTAQTLLQAQGLTASVSDRPSPRPQGTVLEQNPAAGAKVDKGSTVSMVVAAGVEQVSVPGGIVGSDVDTARAKLEGAGFSVTTVSQASDQPAGTVIDQSPAANTQVDAGSTITLTVSDGPSTEPTPSPATTAPSTTTSAPPASTTGAQAPAPEATQ